MLRSIARLQLGFRSRGGVAHESAFPRLGERPPSEADLVYSALSSERTKQPCRLPERIAIRRKERALENVQIQLARLNRGLSPQ